MTTQTSLVFLALAFVTTTASAQDAVWHLAPTITADFGGPTKSKYLVLPYGDANVTYREVGQLTFATNVTGHPTQPFLRQDLVKVTAQYFQNSTSRKLSEPKPQPRVATINARCPSGIELRTADELEAEYHWATIVEGKVYFVYVRASSLKALESPAVKAFLASVEIKMSAGEGR